MNQKKVVITGGAGFIGSHTVDMFLSKGYQVIVIDNLRSGDMKNLKHCIDSIQFVRGDILDADMLREHIDSNTSVVHLAALISVPESIEKPSESHAINVTGTETILSVCREKGALSFVSASSAAVYGNNSKMPLSEVSETGPISPYGLHKLVNEQYGKLYTSLYNLNTIFLRFFNVYGPRQKAEGGYASVIPVFLKKLNAHEAPTIFGDGTTIRDFVFVKDVARALYQATETARASKTPVHDIYNIATGNKTSLSELWNMMCDIKGVSIEPIFGPERIGDIHESYADIRKAKECIKFEALTTMEEGLRELIDYSRKS